MPRTTNALVSGIIEVDASIIPNDAAMLPFIMAANELVTEYCTGPNGPGYKANPPCDDGDDDRCLAPAYPVPYTDERLELIERWLAAHFYSNRDPRVATEAAGSVSASYQSRVDIGFDTSHYGQTAMRLDTYGGLSRINARMKKGVPVVKVGWLGSRQQTQFREGRPWRPY